MICTIALGESYIPIRTHWYPFSFVIDKFTANSTGTVHHEICLAIFTIESCLNDNEQSNGWALYSKNCEPFCFWVRYGGDTSIQINKIFSFNQ